jgi:ribosome biogenesis protein SSF1/2
LRHFSIGTKPVGQPRTVRKTAPTATLPNLAKYKDVADFVLDPGYDSSSEVEEDEKVEVKGVSQRAIRLTELGPRLTLELVKVEEGMCDGKILYHRYVKKSKKEEKDLEVKHKTKADEKARRRKEQEENVARRKAEREAQGGRRSRNKEPADAEAMQVDDGVDEESEVDQEEMLLALENEMEE